MTTQQANFKSFLNLVAGGQHAGGDGQIKTRLFLLHARQGQIEGEVALSGQTRACGLTGTGAGHGASRDWPFSRQNLPVMASRRMTLGRILRCMGRFAQAT